MSRWRRLAFVALGGGLGGAVRLAIAWLLTASEVSTPGSAFAEGLMLLCINGIGALLAGFVRGRLSAKSPGSRRATDLDALLVVGFCGGFTSYSAFVASAVDGWPASPTGVAILVVLTLGLAPLAALVGTRIGRGYPAAQVRSQR